MSNDYQEAVDRLESVTTHPDSSDALLQAVAAQAYATLRLGSIVDVATRELVQLLAAWRVDVDCQPSPSAGDASFIDQLAETVRRGHADGVS